MKKQMEKCKFCNNMFGNTQMLKQHQKKTKYCLKIQEELEKEKTNVQNKELICQFCGKQSKTKYHLNIHQTQTKYCLKIQASQNSQDIISSLITCKFCDKNFSLGSFNRHKMTCKKKNQFLIEEIAKLKAENAEKEIYKVLAERSQNAIEEIARKPMYQKTSNRIVQNNLMISNLTPMQLIQPHVESVIASNYTSNDFYGGQKGAAQMIYKHFVADDNGKSKIICTDIKQGAFHHKNSNGEHIVDYNNSQLIKTVHAPLKKKACEIAAKELVKNPDMMKEINRNSTSIAELTSKPGVFNTAMAEMTGKNSAKELLIETSDRDLAITEEWLIENATFLTIEHILRGPEGYADYALSYPLNDRLIEEEYSNPTFIKYKNRSGDIITDYGGKMLTKMLFDSVKERTYELIESNENVRSECGNIEDSIFQKEFISIVMSNI
jgi:hypothetical protein